VFVGSALGDLYAYPATGCGAATCQPLWQVQTGGQFTSAPSVGGDVVYMGSDDNLDAFDASGCGAATCTPLWQTNVGAAVYLVTPTVAEGQVFVADLGGTLHAYGLPAAPAS
jgi:hypothetical protein